MSKKCIAPFAIFWHNLDKNNAAVGYLEIMKEPDTAEGRQRAYDRMVEWLRAHNMLCEHPEHQPDRFKLQ